MTDTVPRVLPIPSPIAVVGRSLYDKVMFSQAQGVLVGLTGCTRLGLQSHC
jgi:hypothetical protein